MDQNHHFRSIADIMAALMMVFLLIALAFMLSVEASNRELRKT